jgi:hypothetical protein
MKYYDPPMDGDLDAPQMLVCTDTDNFETWNSQTLRILLWTNVPSKQLTQGFYEWQQTYNYSCLNHSTCHWNDQIDNAKRTF